MRRRQWQPTPVLLPGKSHGWRSLVGCSLWCREESDTTEWLHIHFSLSCIGEGNGNPLQCSCLENPRDSGAWWGAVYGVTQSRTRLKRLSSGSSRHPMGIPGGASDKEPTCQWRRRKRPGFDAWVGKIPWRRAWQPTPVFLSRESQGQRRIPGGLQSMGSQRVGHDWNDLACMQTFYIFIYHIWQLYSSQISSQICFTDCRCCYGKKTEERIPA